jgi:hypothetical protein
MDRLEIYPSGWARQPEENFAFLEKHFDSLKEFVDKAAQKKAGLLVYIG